MILGLIPGSMDRPSLPNIAFLYICVNGYIHSAFGNGAWE